MTGTIQPRTVKHIVDTRGLDVTFRREVSGSYDPSSGTVTGASNDDETARVVFTRYNAIEVDGTSIQRGDRKVLMSAFASDGTALSKVPQTNDLLIGEDDTVSVVEARTLKDGGSVIVYILQTRE